MDDRVKAYRAVNCQGRNNRGGALASGAWEGANMGARPRRSTVWCGGVDCGAVLTG